MKYFITILFAIALFSCKEDKPIIAISKASGSDSYKNYPNWLKSLDKEIITVDLYKLDREEALEVLKKSSGLLLTGGPDVHPGRYGKENDADRCSIDLDRDTLEFEIVDLAKKLDLPILGICRGNQLLNVAFGGELIVDIPTDFPSDTKHQIEEGDAYHKVEIVKNSYLYDILEVDEGEVNSNHHQGIHPNDVPKEFKIAAMSPDGLVEAFEYTDKSKPFLMAVTWHPERLGHPIFSDKLGNEFLKEVRKKYNSQKAISENQFEK